MIKDRKTAFTFYVILFVVIWNFADILWKVMAEQSGYTISTGFDIVTPLVIALVTGYMFFLRNGADINRKLKEIRDIGGAVILDVRSIDEYSKGHIPGAINVPVEDIESIGSNVPAKDTPIYSYCLSGARSSRAVTALKAMGYTKAENIGGINQYKGDLE